MSMNKVMLIGILVIAIIIIGAFSYKPEESSRDRGRESQEKQMQSGNEEALLQKTTISFDSVEVVTEVVDTIDTRRRGLSGRESLGEREGMFFVFDTVDHHGIWMKDMLISIDILWFDGDLHVIHIEEEVSPDTFPGIFRPNTPASFVLELPSGFVDMYGIEVGDSAEITF